MSLIPIAVKEYFRKAFVGRTLDEVVEELRQRGVTRVDLSGDWESASNGVDSTYNFYVHYSAETWEGKSVHLKERADRAYSVNWRKDLNQRLNSRKEVLQKALETEEITIKYVQEKVSEY